MGNERICIKCKHSAVDVKEPPCLGCFGSEHRPNYKPKKDYGYRNPEPKKVIFNDPATIVFWHDGTKTVVKAIDEPFDPEKGLAMAFAKKYLGNEGNYYNTFKKHLKKYEK